MRTLLRRYRDLCLDVQTQINMFKKGYTKIQLGLENTLKKLCVLLLLLNTYKVHTITLTHGGKTEA